MGAAIFIADRFIWHNDRIHAHGGGVVEKNYMESIKLSIYVVVSSIYLLIFSLHISFASTVDSIDSAGNIIYLGKAIEDNPDSYAKKMESLLFNGNLSAIRNIGVYLVRLKPLDGNVRALFAISLAADGELERAKDQLSEIENSTTKDLYLNCAQAMIYKGIKENHRALRYAEQAVASDKNHPYPFNILGRIYLDNGEYKEAIDAFQKAISLNNSFLPAYANLGAAYFLAQDYTSAIDHFSNALKKYPNSYDLNYGMAVAQESYGDVAKAMAHYTKCQEIRPDDNNALSSLAKLQLQNLLFQEALATGKKMKANKAEGAFSIIAESSLHLKDYPTALKQIENIDPNKSEKFYLLSYYYLLKGEYKQSLDAVERLLEKEPTHYGANLAKMAVGFYLDTPFRLSKFEIHQWGDANSKAFYFIDGLIDADNGNWDKAYQNWEMAEGLFPGFLMAGLSSEILRTGIKKNELKHIGLAVMLYFRNFYDESLGAFEMAIKNNPSSILSNYFAGHLALQLNNHKKAVYLFENATQHAPNFFSALYAAGELNAALGNIDQAVLLYSQAAEVKSDTGLLIKLGVLNEMTGNNQKAEEAYKKVTGIAPDNFIGYNQLAWLYAKQGIKLDEAITLANKANQLQPENASIQDSLGWIHYQKKQYQKAREYLEAANKIDTENPTILYHLGALYFADGNIKDARKMLTAALEKSTRFEEAEQAKKLLSEIQ